MAYIKILLLKAVFFDNPLLCGALDPLLTAKNEAKQLVSKLLTCDASLTEKQTDICSTTVDKSAGEVRGFNAGS